MDPHTQRAEAERWLGIAAKLLAARDFLGSKTFAIRAREADPHNSVSDQILAVVDTVFAGEKRVCSNQVLDWYGVLQLPRLVRDADLIADHYRKLVFCLSPERNRFPFADYALQLVVDAWGVLSDPNKKWLFDNELSLYLQQTEPGAAVAAQQQTPVVATVEQQASVAGSAAAAAVAGGQVNTFQFFQQQPQQQQQQQQIWEQMQPQQQQQDMQPQQQQQIDQKEFISLQSQQQPQQQQQQQQIGGQQMQPQPQPPQQQQDMQQQQINQREFISLQSQQQPQEWQMRDSMSRGEGGGGGERNKGILIEIGGVNGGGTSAGTAMPQTAATGLAIPDMAQPPPPQPPVNMARVAPMVSVSGGGGNGTSFGNVYDKILNARINDFNNNDGNLNDIDDGTTNEDVNDDDDDDDEDVVEEVDCFWTACPYCLYIYEYQKMYLDCMLRCQNCKRGFHALQIPNPPPISAASKGGGGGKEDKEKGNSFCCWGFYPLGFSMTAWKRQNQNGNVNRSSNWVPFSPMFNCPIDDGGESFKWFDNSGGNGFVGPKNGMKEKTSWVYVDDAEALDDGISGSSDLDSSDDDWRQYKYNKSKTKKRRKGKPRKDNVLKTEIPNVPRGGGVSVGGEDMDNDSDAHEVVFSLAAGDRSDIRKTIPAALARKLTRRSVKDVGRLDLNVEFNNEGEDHAPRVRAANGEEDGIENIAFFEGLDEFLSTLPILNVDGDDKAKPS